MRANRTLEIGTGLFVLLGFAALLFLTTQLPASGVKFGAPRAGYHVSAEFDNIGDLKVGAPVTMAGGRVGEGERSEEHTSELQSQSNIVCRLLLEKKKKKKTSTARLHKP